MFCEQCGKELPENSKFCSVCGAKVASAETVEPEPVSTTEQTKEQAVPEPTPEPEKNAESTPPPKTEKTPPPTPTPVSSTYDSGYKSRDNLVKPLSIGAYIGMFILLCIPVVNLIMLLVWSFSDTVNINKKHFAIAQLILLLIGIILAIGIGVLTAILGAGFYRFYFWQ